MNTTMNVLNPEVIWIDDRCYRVNSYGADDTNFEEHDLYDEEINFNDLDDEGEEDDFEVEMNENGKFFTNLHVSKHYLGQIIGKKGTTIDRIKHETKTDIKTPKIGQNGDVVISGPTASNVKTARRRINIIVISSRMKQRSTHFISIPMNNERIVKSFNDFKVNVLRECAKNGLEESLFIKPAKLHLTIGVMCLMDSEERMQATKLLNDAKEEIILPMLKPHLPLKLRLKGLSYMNDDPREIDVLYGRVQEEGAPSGLLQSLADALVDHFYKGGFMNKEQDNVKLHVTLINSKYGATQSITEALGENSPKMVKVRESFDGSGILQNFGDYDFGVMELSNIHLSQRHSTGSDGYYQQTCVVSCRE